MAIEMDPNGKPLSLPFDPEQTSPVRMRQSDIARLFQVSPARVSQWVKNGQITRYADGLIDPARAARELAKNCDIQRMRAKPFRPLSDEVAKLRATLKTVSEECNHLEKELAETRRRLEVAIVRFGRESAWLSDFSESVEALTETNRCLSDEDWSAEVWRLFDDAAVVDGSLDDIAVVKQADSELYEWLLELHEPVADASTVPHGPHE